MDKYKNAEYLIGTDSDWNSARIPNTLIDVADYICKNGIYGDIVISAYPSGEQVLNTFGFYIDKCPDQKYLAALLPVLIPKQHEIEREIFAETEDDQSEKDEMEME